jgi:hypothetical protein
VALALCATLLICTVQAIILGRRIPFSEAFGTMADSGRSMVMFLIMLVPAALGGLHYLLTLLTDPPALPWPVAAAAPIVLGIAWLFARRYSATGWEAVRG